ncbi:MAG: kynureninase [Pseudomonadota bacterium]
MSETSRHDGAGEFTDVALDQAFAQRLDQEDELASFRDRFHFPRNGEEPVLYLCGNSLGLQPRTTRSYVEELLTSWAERGVEGHFEGERPFAPYHEFARDGLARLVGAEPIEVVAMNSLTVNLHLMLASFYQPQGRRRRMVIERGAFPSDRYALLSHLQVRGMDPEQDLVELAPREGEQCLRTEDICAELESLGDSLATVMLPGVQYYTGEVYDMASIAETAHRCGATVGFDLAHAIGNIPLALHDWQADYAVWCSYKYLNSGPGAVAGAFVHERHAHTALPRFAGWWGHDASNRFKMGPEFSATPGADGWQLSNPPVLALAPVLASLEVFDAAGMTRLREKALRQWSLMYALLRNRLGELVEIITPEQAQRHGCQLSLRLRGDTAHRRDVFARLAAAHVVCDWREPDVIRVAAAPLYNRYEDVWRFVEVLHELLQD